MNRWRRRPSPRAATPSLEVRSEPSRWSACYAPHASMYFDQFGKVRACCQNTGVYLGDVTVQSLREIWESADAERMRTALEAGSFDAGCEFCAWQAREGNDEGVFARQFDELEPPQRRLVWPRQMEFSLTNTCNLACEMCNGDWSSTIRAKREGRPPIPTVYGDEFFEQLAEFLPHLEDVQFLGGEPFLGKEPLRVMEMLAELPDPPRVTVTTNGTLFTDRVQRVIESLRPHIVVSVDGASTETYDAIRIGGHFPEVVANLDRFRAEVGSKRVSLTHCLMRRNWHEFADLLALAEERDLYVGVNVVRFPAELSLYHLDADELDEVVATMAATDVSGLTGQRAAMWRIQRRALELRAEAVRADDGSLGPAHGLAGAGLGPPVDTNGMPSEQQPWPWLPFPTVDPEDPGAMLDEPDERSLLVDIGLDGVIRVRHLGDRPPVDATDLEGADVDELGQRLIASYGPRETWLLPDEADGPQNRFRFVAGTGRPGPTIEIEIVARRGPDGHLIGGSFLLRPGPLATLAPEAAR